MSLKGVLSNLLFFKNKEPLDRKAVNLFHTCPSAPQYVQNSELFLTFIKFLNLKKIQKILISFMVQPSHFNLI